MAQDIVPWILGANALLSIVALLYTAFSSTGRRLQARVEELEERVEGLDDDWSRKAEERSRGLRGEMRDILQELKETNGIASGRQNLVEKHLAVLESRIEQLPSAATTRRIEIQLATLGGRIETLTERIQPVAAVATRLQEHAMEEARRQ